MTTSFKVPHHVCLRSSSSSFCPLQTDHTHSGKNRPNRTTARKKPREPDPTSILARGQQNDKRNVPPLLRQRRRNISIYRGLKLNNATQMFNNEDTGSSDVPRTQTGRGEEQNQCSLKPRVPVARLARARTDGLLSNCAAPRPDGRINKALQCISVTKLAVFHNKVLRSSYQLETIRGPIHHGAAALAEVLTAAPNTSRSACCAVCGEKQRNARPFTDLLHRTHDSNRPPLAPRPLPPSPPHRPRKGLQWKGECSPAGRKDGRGVQRGPPPSRPLPPPSPGNHISGGADRWPISERPAERFDGITTAALMRKFCR